MKRLPGARRLFGLAGRRAPVEQEIDAELEFHFRTEVEALMAAGRSPAEAEAEARRRFGDLRRTRAELARIDLGQRAKERRVSRLEDLRQDAAYALRGFRRQPGFALAVVLTLGIGIGANAVMFGLLDRLLLRPPAHVADAGSVMRFQLTESDAGISESWTNESMAWRTYLDQRDHAGYFASAAAYFTQPEMAVGRGEGASKARVTLATPSYFGLLGVQPARGRFYGEAEDRPEAPEAVAVVSWHYAERALGGADEALGSRLFLGSRTYTVIGVTPKGFNGVDLDAVDAWIPFHAGAPDIVGRSGEWRETYNWQWLKVLARLKPGITRERASDEATRVQRAAVEKIPNVDHRATAELVPLRGFDRKAVSHARERVALWLASVAFVVLLIVCANVANLLLARAASRRREIAVRLALGVGRGRLVRQLLAESLLLALGGGVVALAIARWGGAVLRATVLPTVTWVDSPLDWRVAGITALATLVTGLLTGLAPALQASRPALTSALKQGAAGGGTSRFRLRGGLLAAQAGLSLLLLVGAGLFVRSLWRVVHTDIGYQPSRLLVAEVDLDLAGYPRPAQHGFYLQALERMRGLPGVERAALAINSPFWTMHSTRIRLTDRDSTPRVPNGGPYYNGVTSDYFATLGMRAIAGRLFAAEDRAGSQPVMVINQRMGEFFWPGGNPLGKCVRIGADSLPCAEIVGVVANARVNAIQERSAAMYYVPLDQAQRLGLSQSRMLFLKTRRDPAGQISEVRRAFLGLGTNLPLPQVRTFQSQIDPEIQPWRLGASMFGVFGLLALLVAAIGLYSVMSYAVVQRTREFGIRSALGASSPQIVRAVMRDGLGLVVIGIAGGAAIALLLGRLLEPLLYQTSPRDPLVLAGVIGTLLVASGAAVLVPARRATRVDPLEALRAD
jgi:putative ABC transport system permease protein